jgi:hypothetical protein
MPREIAATDTSYTVQRARSAKAIAEDMKDVFERQLNLVESSNFQKLLNIVQTGIASESPKAAVPPWKLA